MAYFFAAVPPSLLGQPLEAWARYYFDQPASLGEPSDEPFETDSVLLYEIRGPVDEAGIAHIILERVSELHERYAEWTPHYSAAQLSQGMWAMFSYPGSFQILLREEELSFDLRARAMRSLVVPYRVYVKGWDPNESMPHAWDMLWDGIFFREGLSCGIADIGLECLQEILALDDVRCQAYALHGLNHLDHPNRPTIVQAWIDRHGGEGWSLEWLEACRDGTAM